MDACEFFTMLFGSDKFQHLIGELTLATAAKNGGEFSFSQHKLLQVLTDVTLKPMSQSFADP